MRGRLLLRQRWRRHGNNDNDDDDDDVFVYMGGDQEVPLNITYVRVHQSVKIIRRRAFYFCSNLVTVEMHDGVEIIEEEAFRRCYDLSRINLSSVRVIGRSAFRCTSLADIEFGDKLETIGEYAFSCLDLRNIKLPNVRNIEEGAFHGCEHLTEVALSKDLLRIETEAFSDCPQLRHIAMPLKDNLLGNQVFNEWNELSQVDLVGGIHKTVSSLLLERWRNVKG